LEEKELEEFFGYTYIEYKKEVARYIVEGLVVKISLI